MKPRRQAAEGAQSSSAGSSNLFFWILAIWAGVVISTDLATFRSAVGTIFFHFGLGSYRVGPQLAAANFLMHCKAAAVSLLVIGGMIFAGARVVTWFKADPGRDFLSRSLSFALGYGAVSFLLLGLLLTKLWFAPVITLSCALLAGVCALAPGLARRSLFPRPAKPAPYLLPGLFSLLLLVPWLVSPEVHVDGWEYFLAGPERWLHAHGLSLRLASPPLNWPFFAELPYVFGLLAGHDAVPKFLSAAWVLFGIRAFMGALGRTGWGMVLAGVAGCGSLAYAFQTGKNDGIIAAQGLICFACLARASSLSPSSRWVALAAALAGFASASKYTGLLNVIWAPAAVLFITRPGGFKWMAAWFFGGVLLGVPWYLKAYFTTGDPFYPMLSGYLPSIIDGWDERNAQVWNNWRNVGMPDSFFPLRFAAYLVRENPAFAWLAPFLFIWRFREARAGLAALLLGALWHFLFNDPQVERWFFPTVMPAVLAVFAVSGEWARGLSRRKAVFFSATAAVLIFAATVQRFAGQFGIPNPFPYAIGAQSASAYVGSVMGTLTETRECLAREAGGGIVSVSEQHEYGFPKPFYVATPYTSGDAPLIWKIVNSSASQEDIMKKFRQLKADVILINTTRATAACGVFAPFEWTPRMLALYREFCFSRLSPLCPPVHVDQKSGCFHAYRISAKLPGAALRIIYHMPGTETVMAAPLDRLRKGQAASAIAGYGRVYAAFPDVGFHADQLAYAYQLVRMYETAFGYYRKTVEAGLIGEQNLVGYSSCAIRSGKYAEAVAGYSRALEVHPDWKRQLKVYLAKACALRGLSLIKAKKSEEARQILERGLASLEGGVPGLIAEETAAHLSGLLATVMHRLGAETEAVALRSRAAKTIRGLDKLSFEDLEKEFIRAEESLRWVE